MITLLVFCEFPFRSIKLQFTHFFLTISIYNFRNVITGQYMNIQYLNNFNRFKIEFRPRHLTTFKKSYLKGNIIINFLYSIPLLSRFLPLRKQFFGTLHSTPQWQVWARENSASAFPQFANHPITIRINRCLQCYKA